MQTPLSRRTRMVWGVVSGCALLAGLGWWLGHQIPRLLFYPDQTVYASPAQMQVRMDEVWFPAEDGSQLHGWWLPAADGAASPCTVVHAHGNAANISNHLPLVAWLPAQGVNVLMFDYRGYGQSGGQPTLNGVVADVEAALRAARARPGVDSERLVLFGQSLGGATALRAAARTPQGTLRGVMLDSAFASYRGMGRDAARQTMVPDGLASALLLSLPGPAEDPVAAMAQLKLPVWLMHGDADTVIPMAHAEQLLAAAEGPAHLLRIPGGQHIHALMDLDLRPRFLDALNTMCSTPPATP